MSATETWEMDITDMIRNEIVQHKDNGDIIGPADIDDMVRDLISNMDTSDFVDEDTVAESVLNHYTFTDAIDDAVMQKLDYEGMGETPTLIEGLEERVNALECNPAATDNDGYNALVNTVTNLTERIVYMEGIINALVDALQPAPTNTTTTDDAPYAAL